ncbi:MAG: phosphate/phosphite/phosphonate ABC transporter substrate-binding protein [Thermodesulfobacteriota bacterium]
MRNWIWIIVLILTACTRHESDQAYQRVDFSKTVSEIEAPQAPSHARSLKVAVAAMISPKETFVHYQELIRYVSNKAEVDTQLIQRKTYGEINELFAKGQLDLAFICSGPYASGKESFSFRGLATPIIRGKPFYHSYLIVHKDAVYQRIEDLRGRVFAFTDPESNTGALVPTFWISQLGETPKTFFKEIVYTYSHDNSILAVSRKLVEGAAVDGHKWDYYENQDSVYTGQTRVIKKSDPFGSPPIVVSLLLQDALFEKLRSVIISMHTDPDGRRILDNLMIDRFSPIREEWYEPVRQMILKIRNSETVHGKAGKS